MSSPDANTKMVNPGKQVQMVKVKVNHPIRVIRDGFESVISPDANPDKSKRKAVLAEITEDEAKEFCDKEFNIGFREVFGAIPAGDYIKPTVIKRAERL